MSGGKKGLPREESNKIQKLMKFLEQKPECYEFLRPVDHKGLGLSDYTTIIQKPMDISTVKKNLRNSAYSDIQDVLDDITLIWENCKTYNPKELHIHKQAEKMQQFMGSFMASHAWEVNSAAKRPREVPLDKRIEFVESLKDRSEEEVARIIESLSQSCPRAVIRIGEEKLQVKIDLIDASTFETLLQSDDSYKKQKLD